MAKESSRNTATREKKQIVQVRFRKGISPHYALQAKTKVAIRSKSNIKYAASTK